MVIESRAHKLGELRFRVGLHRKINYDQGKGLFQG
jgi:hypothetical protein